MRSEAEIAEMQYWDERKAKLGQEATLRDQFAMAAMKGMQIEYIDMCSSDGFIFKVAARAYDMAEAMMAERARRLTNPDE